VKSAVAESWTVLPLLRTTARFLSERGVAEPRLSAEHLLADALGCRRLDLYLRFDRPVTETELEAYRGAVRRRMAGEPVPYITGRAGFRGLDLAVDRRVLIPRPETELLVGEVLAWARGEAERGRTPPAGWRVLDVGTGSGAIALALAAELQDVRVIVAADRSRAALAVAQDNARRLGLPRVAFVAGDALEPFRADGAFDIVVTNPPYVPRAERADLPADVREWEPAGALHPGPRGDEALAGIVAAAPARLRAGGLLALELGRGQADGVEAAIRGHAALAFLARYRDYAGIDRGVLAVARPE
jgi:release factor glutamine methyltransferase